MTNANDKKFRESIFVYVCRRRREPLTLWQAVCAYKMCSKQAFRRQRVTQLRFNTIKLSRFLCIFKSLLCTCINYSYGRPQCAQFTNCLRAWGVHNCKCHTSFSPEAFSFAGVLVHSNWFFDFWHAPQVKLNKFLLNGISIWNRLSTNNAIFGERWMTLNMYALREVAAFDCHRSNQ